jgi:TolA-binding protein
VTTVQRLTTQLREREGRLRQREEELQQKDTQIQQKDADISRLQREIQRLQVGIIVAGYIPYSGKFSWGPIFAVFADKRPSANIRPMKYDIV